MAISIELAMPSIPKQHTTFFIRIGFTLLTEAQQWFHVLPNQCLPAITTSDEACSVTRLTGRDRWFRIAANLLYPSKIPWIKQGYYDTMVQPGKYPQCYHSQTDKFHNELLCHRSHLQYMLDGTLPVRPSSDSSHQESRSNPLHRKRNSITLGPVSVHGTF